MSVTLPVKLDDDVKRRLELLAERSNRPSSLLAAEAIAAYVEAQEWQLAEIDGGVRELDRGEAVDHETVEVWLRSWGEPDEGAAP